jgi:hypothetical protein
MSFTWLVLFVVIGLTGAWWWQNHKAQQEEITTMADQSSAELNQAGSDNAQNVPLNTDGAASPASRKRQQQMHLQPTLRRLRRHGNTLHRRLRIKTRLLPLLRRMLILRRTRLRHCACDIAQRHCQPAGGYDCSRSQRAGDELQRRLLAGSD